MQTKLALFCDKLIEAGWLGVAALIPLFFNVYSSRVFEPDKLTVFRGIALIMAVAWVIKTAEDWSSVRDLRAGLRRLATASPLSLPVLIFLAVYLLTTATSIDPNLSFWGSYQRLQGTLNNLGYLALFFLTLHHLRTRAQLERLFSVVLITSLPISLYGIIQHFGLDPLPWGGDVRQRVTANMGNAIFLSAYLIMVVPLTLLRLARAVRNYWQQQTRAGASGNDWRRLLFVAIYLALLVAQAVAIYFTFSRGPWLGGFTAVGVFALLLLLRWRQWVLFGAGLLVALVFGSFVLLLNLDNSPLASLRNSSYTLQRLGTMMETETGTNRVRVLIWRGDEVGKGAIGLITDSPFRFLLGYGPEAMYVAYNPYYPPELAHFEARNASPDRSHNDLLDFMVTMGLVGLLSYLGLVVVFFATGVRHLWRQEDWNVQLILIGLLAAVAGHLVESFFGIAVAATRTHFWLYLAALAAVPTLVGLGAARPVARAGALPRGRSLDESAPPVPVPARPEPVAAGVGAGRGAAYPARPAGASKGGKARAARRAGAVPPPRPPSPFPALAPGLSFVPLAIYLIVSIAGTLFVLLGNLGQRLEPSGLVITGFVWVIVGLLLTAAWLPRPGNPRLAYYPNRLWLHIPLVLVSLYVIMYVFLGSVIADIYFKKGQAYDAAQRHEGSIPAYLDALDWAPNQDFYFLFLGRAYLELAKRVPDQAVATTVEKVEDLRKLNLTRPQELSRDLLFNASLVSLRRARELSPLNTDNSANMARLHRFWAEVTADPARRQERFDVAVDFYRQATALSPNSAHLYDEWGVVYHLQGRYDEAIERYLQAVRLDSQYPVSFVYLGDAYLAQSQAAEASGTPNASRMEEAAQMYRKALALDNSLVGAHSALGFILQRQGRLQEALVENKKAAELAPNDLVTRRNLAILYSDAGEVDKAIAEAEAALKLAPKEQQAPLQGFIDQLKLRRK